MKNLLKVVLLSALMALLVVPMVAQEQVPAAGEGGFVIEGYFGGSDVSSLNPLIANDSASNTIIGFIFPGMLSIDPATKLPQKGQDDALIIDWEISEDGLTYTYTMRTDWTWTDGDTIDSADVQYYWDALSSGAVQGFAGTYYPIFIESVTTPSPDKFVVQFKEASCRALPLGSLGVVPSHIFPTDFAEVNDLDYNQIPDVTGGVFNFSEFRPGEQFTLLANQNFGGAENGQVIPTGYIYLNVPDQNILIERFLAGDSNIISFVPPNRRDDVKVAAGIKSLEFSPGNTWDYLAMNYADPSNPQSAYDEAGNRLEQGNHPIFGDNRVRSAVSLAINVDDIVDGAVFGYGERMNAYQVPGTWGYNEELALIPFDTAAAIALLEEAGWVDHDNNPSTPRVAQGAMYAADGTTLSFTLYTNQGNSRREAIGAIVQDQLQEIGFEVNFQTVDFTTILDIIDGQTFDAFILGWGASVLSDPDLTQLFGSESDVLGAGSNAVSYYNPTVDELLSKALNLPGCDPVERKVIYDEISVLMQADLPYVPLYAITGFYAASEKVVPWTEFGGFPYNSIDTWYVRQN